MIEKTNALLVSAKGIHADGWVENIASLVVVSNRPFRLHFNLPPAPLVSQSKIVYIKHNGEHQKLEVIRGALTPSTFLAPNDGTTRIEIDCEYSEVGGDRERRKLGVHVSKLEILGEAPIDFTVFLKNSYDSARTIVAKGGKNGLSSTRLRRHHELTMKEGRKGTLQILAKGSSVDFLTGCIFVDGVSVREVTLARPKGSSVVIDQLEAEWCIPPEYSDGFLHVYSFELHEEGLENRTDPIVVRNPEYYVEIEDVDFDHVSGWVYRVGKASPIILDASLDGLPLTKVAACGSRQDVRSAHGINHDTVGFRVDFVRLQPRNADGTTKSIQLTLNDADNKIQIAEVSIVSSYRSLTNLAAKYREAATGLEVRAVLGSPIESSSSKATFAIQKAPVRSVSTSQSEIAIVIPIYGGAVETTECLESVLAARNTTSCKLFLVNDCSPDAVINDLVDQIEKRGIPNVFVIRSKKNRGFSASVNLGIIAAGDRDVILLNSDTVVGDGWVDRLVKAASRDGRIGTVTPLTNNGEIVSLPYQCRSVLVNDLSLAKEVDQIAEEVNSTRQPIDIPVAIGFCMYIKRRCLDEVGLFNAELWGRGYGEEVDFCLNAKAYGWRHVVATDVFVVHRGNASFGDEKFKRIVESAKKISAIYPFYDELIQRFILTDAIAPARRAINLALMDRELGGSRILHVVHSFGGGTEKYVQDLARIHREQGQTTLIVRFDSSQRAELEVDLSGTKLEGLFDLRHVESYSNDELEELKKDVFALNIARIHLHSPFGLPKQLIDWLTTTYEFDVTVHDYAWICPRASLTQPGGRYCGEPNVEKCDACTSLYLPHPGLSQLLSEFNGSVTRYRETLSAVLYRAARVIVGSDDVSVRLLRHGVEATYVVTPHPETTKPLGQLTKSARISDGWVRVALFGAVSAIKGFHRLIACARYAHENRLPITFIVFGYTMNDDLAASIGNIIVTGRYEDENLGRLIDEHAPDISFFPNQWPETYSYTLSHSFRARVWPVVTDLGAPAARVAASGFGEVIPYDLNELALCKILLEAAQNHSLRSSSSRH